MTLSRYEMYALCRKAARGAGYDWGMAEEVATASVYLCTQGFDPTDELIAFLSAGACDDGPSWPPSGDRLCPFMVGCGIADRNGQSTPLIVGNVCAPIFICAFLARDTKSAWTVRWDGCHVDIGGGVLAITGLPAIDGECTVTIDNAESVPISKPLKPAFPSTEPRGLLNFAVKTYVPDSAASRARGAG